ncbi:MAG: dihydropteroate synthase [Candidatus Omnitrophica bacterium]|nr:dihydropteroate synthase [Candidatus Omnitrophota bacterium]MCF7877141.1 dihydropteroate synthase [Candidatus Omnitrophota bacterium]MCF7892394.1 dihydropteroate synthase [Candidatus Omnitrophota bacterium]MCF7895629.1 dihydropteroate synthase [Candidatus Omnitrophota bacterium]MCF7898036.1 dihydropteroate synthase [Candidatus Omnitrophota bacterium]
MNIVPLVLNNQKEAKEIMLSLGATPAGAKILAPKGVFKSFKIEGIKSWEANILKQHLLSLGSDAAIERDALVKDIETGVLLFGSINQLNNLCGKLKDQTKRLRLLSKQLAKSLDNVQKTSYLYKARDKRLRINKPIICGIVNITKDSFSGDGLLKEAGVSVGKLEKLVLDKVSRMFKSGAKIIDFGAESSRPFSKRISSQEEIKRIVPVLKAVRKRFKKLIISIDTHKPKVAKAVIEEGADVINDITALKNNQMASLLKKHNLGCILMHMQGNPENMQVNPSYNRVSEEIGSFFQERLDYCQGEGIGRERIFIDPGIGFGKLKEHNLDIINNLYQFKKFGVPIFLGLSRKSFLGDIIKKSPAGRLGATIAAELVALNQGANVLRVHDVKETNEAIKVFSQLLKK